MEQTIQPIEKNVWWVIPAKLAGVRKPLADELINLQTVGIGAIVSVFHDSSNLDLYQQVGIPHLWIPIEVDAVPTQEQIQKFQDFVDHQNCLDHAVAVHCSTGKHRTGTILASYLIGTGSSYEEAMRTILEVNPGIELPKTQAGFLQKLAQKKSDFHD